MKIAFLILCLVASFHTFAEELSSPASMGALGTSKKVIGIYPREQITDASNYPERTIGQIASGCTGTLISPRHILTAGHCVYDVNKAEWLNDLRFFPGRTSKTDKPYVIEWKKVYVQQKFTETGYASLDFAVIELAEPIGDKLGWSGFKALSENEYNNKIKITGYPADKDLGTLWTVSCPGRVENKKLLHQCDTYGGMSGSAIYTLPTDSQNPMITAVHTWGIGKQNGGVFISEDNFRLINSWKNNSGITDETAIYEKVETVEKQLFGKYQRQQITDASELPYRIVGEIGRGCTATLIGPKHILTAAHCVYDVHSTQWSVRPIFTPGQVSNGEYPLGKYVASKIYIQKDFMERAAAEYDFAVLELKEPIGDKLGWGNLEVIDETFNKTLRITGYPVDKILDTMWTVTCPVKAVGSQLQYRCDTYNGMSGSSLMSTNPNSNPAIYGVHSGSENDYNAGVMINQKTFDLIESWVKGAPLSDRTMVRETKF